MRFIVNTRTAAKWRISLIGGMKRLNISAHGGRVTILIDSAQDEKTQRHALRHELAHVALNHLTDTTRSLQQLEAEADEYAARMTDSEFADLMKGAIV